MAQIRYFKAGLESEFGGGATTFTPMRVRSIDLSVDQGIIWDETVEGYLPAAGIAGPLGITCRIEAALRPTQLAPLLDAALSLDAQGNLGEPKSLEIVFADEVKEYSLKGVGVRSLEFTFEAREAVTVTADCIAKTLSTSSVGSMPTYSDEEPLAFQYATVYAGDKGGTPTLLARCRGVTLTIDRGLADDFYVIGDRTLAGLHAGITNMNGRLTVYASEWDTFARAISVNDFSYMSLKIEAARGNSYFRVTAPIAAVNSGSFAVRARDLITREIEYRVCGIPQIEFG